MIRIDNETPYMIKLPLTEGEFSPIVRFFYYG
jgi:hypothetical protein